MIVNVDKSMFSLKPDHTHTHLVRHETRWLEMTGAILQLQHWL